MNYECLAGRDKKQMIWKGRHCLGKFFFREPEDLPLFFLKIICSIINQVVIRSDMTSVNQFFFGF